MNEHLETTPPMEALRLECLKLAVGLIIADGQKNASSHLADRALYLASRFAEFITDTLPPVDVKEAR